MASIALTRRDTTMLLLPPDIIALLLPFAPLFSPSVFRNAQLLLVGALLAPGKRTVTAALRAMGHAHDRHFQNYHRVLNCAHWSCHRAAGILLKLLVATFVPEGTLVFGLDFYPRTPFWREDRRQRRLPRRRPLQQTILQQVRVPCAG